VQVCCSIFFQKGSHSVQPRDFQCSFFQFLSDKKEHDHHCLIPCFKPNLLIQFLSSYSIMSTSLSDLFLDNFWIYFLSPINFYSLLFPCLNLYISCLRTPQMGEFFTLSIYLLLPLCTDMYPSMRKWCREKPELKTQ